MRTRFAAMLSSLVCGCVDPAVDLAEVEKPTSSCVAIDDRSLVETNPSIVSDERFSLQRVFERIRDTTPTGYTVPALADMFAQLYTAYATCPDVADPPGYGLACREAEALLAAHDPFTGDAEGVHFQPVALVGRYDMANAKADTCGESRIVYWMDRGPIGGKAGVIVELYTPPVYDDHGHADCAPIAAFWASLSDEADPQARAAMLDAFYFEGLAGMPYAPASAYGAGWGGRGQLRANNFVERAQWNLREAQWTGTCGPDGCRAGFVLATSKSSPSEKLFTDTHPDAAAFQHWFISKALPRLARATSPNELSLGNADVFDAYESISQPRAGDPSSVLYAQVAGPLLRARIADKLAEERSTLTVDNVLDRATAATCAGCHRVSRNADLGDGLVFPAPLGFVHVDEVGALSPAMIEHFLPARRQLLQDEVCGKGKQPDAGETVGGKLLNEPN